MKTIRNFLSDETGFQGAEKALLACVGLAIILAVGKLLTSGAEQAGKDAESALKKNPLGGG
jgi:Flp pilus assembly pilin Flp